VAESRTTHFRSGKNANYEIDHALKRAQIEKLYASAAKDWQDVRESIQESFETYKSR